MEWVRERLGFAADATVACGDGANDLLMLQRARLAICVGNAQPEVRSWALGVREIQTRPELSRRPAAALAGRGGGNEGLDGRRVADGFDRQPGDHVMQQRVHLAQPDAHAAAGILQGLAAFAFI